MAHEITPHKASEPKLDREIASATKTTSIQATSSSGIPRPYAETDKELADKLFGKVEIIGSELSSESQPESSEPTGRSKPEAESRKESDDEARGGERGKSGKDEDILIDKAPDENTRLLVSIIDELPKATTDAKGRSREFTHNFGGELIEVKMENDETWTRARQEGKVWVWTSDKGRPERRFLNQEVLEDGTLFIETSSQNRIYYNQNGTKEIVDYKEMLALASAIRGATFGPGTNETTVYQCLEGKTPRQLECLQDVYAKEFEITLEDDLSEDMSGAELTRALQLLRGHSDSVAEIEIALEELGQMTGRSDALLEGLIRNTLSTMDYDAVKVADEEYSLRTGQTLREALKNDPNLSEPTKAALEIRMKGFDRLSPADHRKLVEIGLENRDSILFQEAMRSAPQELRDYYSSSEGKQKVHDAFAPSVFETAAAIALSGVPVIGGMVGTHQRQRLEHARDYAEEGRLKLSTKIMENSSMLGDNEEAVELLLNSSSDRERQDYRIGRWLSGGNRTEISEADRAAYNNYSKSERQHAKKFYKETFGALEDVAGLWLKDGAECELIKWESLITTPGGGLVAQLANHNKVFDTNIDGVLSDIEQMNEGEWSRLANEPGYKKEIERVLGTFLSSSELDRAKAILDGKASAETFDESKESRRGLLQTLEDNLGDDLNIQNVYDAFRDMRSIDVYKLRENNGDNEFARTIRSTLEEALGYQEFDLKAASGMMDRIIESGETKRSVFDILNIHASEDNPDERQVMKEVEQAFLDDPRMRVKILNDPELMNEFIDVGRAAMGWSDYKNYLAPLLKTGVFTDEARMRLNSSLFDDDEAGSYEDAASIGKASPNPTSKTEIDKFEATISYLSEEQRKIARNAFQQGELHPEDKIRVAVLGGGTDEDPIKAILEELRATDKPEYAQLTPDEIDARIKVDLEKMKSEYLHKYGEDMEARLITEFSERDFKDVQPQLDMLSNEWEFLMAQRQAIETRDGIGSSLNDVLWDGTGFQVDEGVRDLVQSMQQDPSMVRQFAQQLHGAVNLHGASKEAMANAIVDATITAAAVGGSAFTGGASLTLLTCTALAGALFKVGTKAALMGGDYDLASMGIFDAAGGAFDGATMFLGTGLFKAGGKAGLQAADEVLQEGGEFLAREMMESAFKKDVQALVVTSLKEQSAGITSSAIRQLATRYAGPAHVDDLARLLTKSINKSVTEVGEQWLKNTAIRAANSAVNGAIAGAGSGAIRAARTARTVDEFEQQTMMSAVIGSVSAGTASVGCSVASRLIEKAVPAANVAPEVLAAPEHLNEPNTGPIEIVGLSNSRPTVDSPANIGTAASDVLDDRIKPILDAIEGRYADDLVLRSGDHTFALEPGQSVMIGRFGKELPLDPSHPNYDMVSRRHLILSRGQDGLYSVRDASSLNGTYLNYWPMKPGVPQRVGDLDRLTLGDTFGPEITIGSKRNLSTEGFDGQQVRVGGAHPNKQFYRYGKHEQKLLFSDSRPYFQGQKPIAPVAPTAIRVNVGDADDLRLVQSALIPELGGNRSINRYVEGWDTMDPNFGVGKLGYGYNPNGYKEGASGFTILLKERFNDDAKRIAERIDSIINRKGLSLGRPLPTENGETIVGASNRVGLVDDYFSAESMARRPIGAASEAPIFQQKAKYFYPKYPETEAPSTQVEDVVIKSEPKVVLAETPVVKPQEVASEASDLLTTPMKQYRKTQTVTATQSTEPFNWTNSKGEVMHAEAGDWKVLQPDGSTSSIKPDIFKESYERLPSGEFRKSAITSAQQADRQLTVMTLEGPCTGSAGDYLVTGVKGEKYFVSRAKFEKMYEPVPE